VHLVLLSIDVCILRKLDNIFRSPLPPGSYLLPIWRPYIDNRIGRERLRDEFGTVVEFGNPSEIRLHVHGMLLVRISDIRIHVVYTLFVMADNRPHHSVFTSNANRLFACLLLIGNVRSKHFCSLFFNISVTSQSSSTTLCCFDTSA